MNRKLSPFWTLFTLTGLNLFNYLDRQVLPAVFPAAKRNNALTIFYVAIPVGAALGYVIGGTVALRASWRYAFIYAGAPGLLFALTLLPFVEPARGASDASKAHEPPKLGDLAQLVRNANYLLVVSGYVAYTAGVAGVGHWLPSSFERYHGMNTESAGLFFGATMACAGLIGTMAGGFAATGWQRRNPAGYAWMLTISACLAAPLAAASMLAPGRISAAVWIALALFCVWLPTGPINTLILESVPSNLRASAMAGSIFAIHLFGDMWSPQIVGAVSDRTASLRLGLLLLPGALLVGAALWLALALRTRRGVDRKSV